MSRYNLFISALVITLAIAHGATAQTKKTSFNTLSVGYVSWVELMSLDSGTVVDEAFANFYGTSVMYEYEQYENRRGSIVSVGGIFGKANGGGTQTTITYQKAYQTFAAGKADYKFAYRMSPQITTSVGPFVMFRQITWDKQNVMDVKSGADVNLGMVLDLRVRFNPKWEMQQTFGTMAFKASTYWSVALGYKF